MELERALTRLSIFMIVDIINHPFYVGCVCMLYAFLALIFSFHILKVFQLLYNHYFMLI